jgi:hypothetical protein
VSMLEDAINPSDASQQLNFLSTNGLSCWQSGSCGAGITESHATAQTSPFTYHNPADPEMQSMNNMHLAMASGSERWFQPLSTGGWRTTTKIGITTATGTSPRQGVLVVYGDAYGDTANGRVMYMGSHDLTAGGGAAAQDRISAIRTYFNFMLLAGKDRALRLSVIMPPDTLLSGSNPTVSVEIQTGTPPFTYSWTSLWGGTFSNPTGAVTSYAPPNSITSDTFDVVRVVITDACNRTMFETKRIFLCRAASSFTGIRLWKPTTTILL